MNIRSIIVASSLGASGLLLPALAQARLDACGGVFLSGDAKCEFVRDRDCATHCEATSVETACVASLQTDCESRCTASTEQDCTQTCTPSCTEECTKDDKQSSRGLCRSECAQDCSAKCAGKDDHCMPCCQQNCNVRCEDHCHDDDTAEVCDTKCTPVCEDSCVAKSTNSCQIDCQTTNFESCQTTTVQTCQTDCHDSGGAIFCDGQFLKVSSLKDCAAQLADQLNIKVDINLNVDVDTTGSGVTVTDNGKKHTAKCSVGAAGANTSGGGLALLFGVAAVGALTRRRRA